MRDVAAIIEDLGGPAPVAEALNVPPTTAGNWKARGSIPARYWAALLAFASSKRLSLTSDDLVKAHAKPLKHGGARPLSGSAVAVAGPDLREAI